MWKRIAQLVLMLVMALPVVGNAGKEETPKPELVFKFLLESNTSLHAVFFQMAMAGVSNEAMVAVRDDLAKKGVTFGSRLPKVTLNSNIFYVDGKPTPLKLDSADPVRLSLDGVKWSYNKNQPFDANYNSLLKYLTPKSRQNAFWRGISVLPVADAMDKGTKPFVLFGSAGAGVAASAMAGMFAYSKGILLPFSPLLVAGMVLGAGVGYAITETADFAESAKNNMVDFILQSDFEIKCSDREVVVLTKDSKGKNAILIEKTPNSDKILFGFISETGRKQKSFTEREIRSLLALAECETPAQAQAIKVQMRKAAEIVMAIASQGVAVPEGLMPEVKPVKTQKD